jgi:hypothetical protein
MKVKMLELGPIIKENYLNQPQAEQLGHKEEYLDKLFLVMEEILQGVNKE